MVFKLLTALLFCVSTSAIAGTGRSAPKIARLTADRTVMIDGVITGTNLEPLGNALLKWSIENVSAPVVIIIDSPGGAVIGGTLFINKMEAVRARGTKIRCYVSGVAASMAFSVLLHCDERYALANTYLLWHPVRVAPGAVTARESAAIGRSLKALDRWILRDTASEVRIPLRDVRYHFYNESLHYARELETMDPSFITVANAFPGLLETAADPKLKKSQVPLMFFFGGASTYFKPGTIIYMFE